MSIWKNIVRKIAPTLGTALGGPMAGTAVKFIADKVLGKPEASESEVAEFMLGASPDQLAELRRIDADFKVRMKEIGVDVFKLEVEDRKSARGLFSINIWPQIILSAIFIVGYFFILGMMLTGGIKVEESMRPIFMTILGVLTASVPSIMQFWFGSSLGSKEKTAKLNGQ